MKRTVTTLAALSLVLAACATAPETVEVPRAEEPPPERPVEPPRPDPFRIGMVLSTSGSATLQQYAGLVLDGARVGAAAADVDERAIELIVRDDGGTLDGAARAIRELEDAGARIVIGPLTDDALAAAARARSDEDLTLIGPMAVYDPPSLPNVYALNVVDTRGATALGEYARRYDRAGVLYPRSPEGQRHARAFMEAYGRGGHGSVTDAAFGATTTNVAAELGRLQQARVQAIYFPGSDRELQVVLPQIEYFGLKGVQLLGGDPWVSDAARGLPQRVLQGAIIATPLLRDSDELEWQTFVERYEARYRRSLENPVPALGYDAVLLAAHLAGGGNGTFAGATGVFTVHSDSVTRRPFLVRIDAGRLVPVN